MILIFSIKFDYSTSCVIRLLSQCGVKVVRINGDDDIYKFAGVSEEGIFFTNTITSEKINLLDAKACWWRRTGIKMIHLDSLPVRGRLCIGDMDLTEFIRGNRSYLADESKSLIEYIFYTVYQNCQINLGKPLFNLNRLITASIAKKHGFLVPSFQIVNNNQQLKQIPRSITKSIANGIYRDIRNRRYYTYTELIEEEFIQTNKNNLYFPSLVMTLVEKKIEIRTFFIDGHFFSMAIFSQSSEQTRIDFRKYGNNRREPYQLPLEIEKRLKCVFAELELNSGSIDLVVDKDDNFVFLEINPVGQFAMTSEPCNYNLHTIVSNYLQYGKSTIN